MKSMSIITTIWILKMNKGLCWLLFEVTEKINVINKNIKSIKGLN